MARQATSGHAASALPKLHIGGLAARTGRSVHTIRWYEAQGLIPGVVRDSAGRRLYSEPHVGWLELMERLRTTGMSIAQMRRYTVLVKAGGSTLVERRMMLDAHRARVLEAIAAHRAALALIDAKVDFYDEWIAGGSKPALEPMERLAQRRADSGRMPATGGST